MYFLVALPEEMIIPLTITEVYFTTPSQFKRVWRNFVLSFHEAKTNMDEVRPKLF